jgi:hypothetical protein
MRSILCEAFRGRAGKLATGNVRVGRPHVCLGPRASQMRLSHINARRCRAYPLSQLHPGPAVAGRAAIRRDGVGEIAVQFIAPPLSNRLGHPAVQIDADFIVRALGIGDVRVPVLSKEDHHRHEDDEKRPAGFAHGMSSPQLRGHCAAHAAISIFVIGDRDELVVVLAAPLVHQEIVIAAAAVAGIIPARERARMIDRATPELGIEELADAAVMFVALAAHQILVAVAFAREAPLGRLVFQIEVPGEALDVALVERDHGI